MKPVHHSSAVATKPRAARPGHRHSAPGQHEHDSEPQFGLPEALPADERLIWQGSPDWRTLAVRRFHIRKLAGYFAIMLAARMATLLSDGASMEAALRGTLPMLALSVVAVGLVTLIAWLTSRTTVYTLTDKRVVMRIGIVLTISLNLPLARLEAADLKSHDGSTGDIALRLHAPARIAYLHLWPHARPWRLSRPEPTLLCVVAAPAVASALTEAWRLSSGSKARSLEPSSAATSGGRQPGLAAQ